MEDVSRCVRSDVFADTVSGGALLDGKEVVGWKFGRRPWVSGGVETGGVVVMGQSRVHVVWCCTVPSTLDFSRARINPRCGTHILCKEIPWWRYLSASEVDIVNSFWCHEKEVTALVVKNMVPWKLELPHEQVLQCWGHIIICKYRTKPVAPSFN